jgi:tetratricopeptide (TPR) repeat protein
MAPMTSDDALRQLVAYIVEGRCALFVGPDIGESAGGFRGLPTTWQLADELARRCNYRGRYRSIADLAGPCERILGSHWELVRWLRQRIDRPEYRPLPIHRLIATLSFPIIVSGGWDTLLETALSEQQIRFRPIRRNTDLPYVDPRGPDVLLFKPYGSVADPESLVISENDQLEVFYNLGQVIKRLEGIIEQYCLLLVGYAPAQDSVFVRMYHAVRREQGEHKPRAFAVQSLYRPDTSADWEARGVVPIISDPATFLRDLSLAVAAAQGRELRLPDLDALSDAPRLTTAELSEQAALLDAALNQLGVSDLVEQTSVPLLSEEQLQDIEAMRAAYERLAQGFAPEETSSRVWLLQGNIEYVRQNYARAGDYYQRALAAEPDMAEAYHNLHFVQLARHDRPGAMEAYQRAVSLKSELAILPHRYRIEGVLGSGGLGTVYRAWDTQENRPVAAKVLQRQYAQTEQALAQFKREATILQGLDHPNIVRLYDFAGYLGGYFIVMELLEGETLKERLSARQEPMSLRQTYEITDQVCAALIYTHGHGMVHRDVKPSNLFLAGDTVKLIDFGLARPLAGGQLSTASVPSGTIEYMAPEQVEGKIGDQRTDVYAVATVFYEMLTRRSPSQGTYRPPSELVPGLNEALDLVVEKARERAPEDRHPSISALNSELAQVVAMQAAAANTPWWLRLTAHVANALKIATERLWPWLMLVAGVLGFVVPALTGNRTLDDGVRVIAVLIVMSLMSATLAGWATVALARRGRGAAIAAYGRAMGAVLGVLNGVIWLQSFRFTDVPGLGVLSAELFLYALLFYLAGSLIFLLAELLAMLAAGSLTRSAGRRYASGFFMAFLAEFVTLTAVAILARYPWFGGTL